MWDVERKLQLLEKYPPTNLKEASRARGRARFYGWIHLLLLVSITTIAVLLSHALWMLTFVTLHGWEWEHVFMICFSPFLFALIWRTGFRSIRYSTTHFGVVAVAHGKAYTTYMKSKKKDAVPGSPSPADIEM